MADVALDEALTRIANLTEALSDLEQLAREDRGWDRIIGDLNQDFTAEGRRRISDLCEVMTVANPLIKRGFLLRHSYVWGAGHQVSVPAGENDADGEINAAVQAMFDDDRNAVSLTSEEAVTGLERWLYTHGAVALLCDTDPDSGDVVVRQEDPDRIVDHIADPEDAKTVWYWKRQYSTRQLRKDGSPGATKTVTVWHPDIAYHPTGEDRLDLIGGKPVRWDQPLLIRTVNTPATPGWSWGIGDAYAAVAWARMSKEFLKAWFTLMRALSRYAWRTSTKGTAATRAAQAAKAAQATAANPTGAGAHVFTDQATSLEAVPKTGATIDASSGLPLQQMVAAGLDVPLTMLLGDPGTTGARSVAETLDQPMELAMGARRRFWGEVFDQLGRHAVAAKILAEKLAGTVQDVDGRRLLTLPEGCTCNVVVDWPAYNSTPVDVAMKALRDADGLDVLPPLLVARLALQILGVDDLDEWIDQLTDGDGEYLPPSRGAVEAARQRVAP